MCRNPWTKDVECLVANNTIVSEAHGGAHADAAHSSYDIYKQSEYSTAREISYCIRAILVDSLISMQGTRTVNHR